MIIVRAAGGLGNQMQQYALYRKLKSLGRDAKMDLSWFDEADQRSVQTPRALELLRFRDLPLDVCTKQEKKALAGGSGIAAKIGRKLFGSGHVFEESEMYHPEIFAMEDMYLQGYFACEKYYADILPALRKDFVFPEAESGDAAKRNAAFLKNAADDPGSVSIHIRRGDYLAPENAALLGGICTDAYYGGAIREVRKAAGGAPLTFYVFSDDPEYARTLHFGDAQEENIVADWNTGEDNLLDMQLMSACRANICANSTFSFWGARLNARGDRICVRPSSHRNNQVSEKEKMHDYWKGWILIDKEGKLF